MTALVFVDANVLVYERDLGQPQKRAQALAWMEWLWRERRGRVSTQVLNEFYVTATQRLRPGLPREAARQVVQNLYSWRPLAIDRTIIDGAFRLQDRFNLSHWDALIVASARIAGCSHLLTEDLAEGMDYEGLRVVDPFRLAPGAPLP